MEKVRFTAEKARQERVWNGMDVSDLIHSLATAEVEIKRLREYTPGRLREFIEQRYPKTNLPGWFQQDVVAACLWKFIDEYERHVKAAEAGGKDGE